MSVAEESEPGPGASPESEGVLANLPRTRPQRPSPRRAAARAATAVNVASAVKKPSPAPRGSTRTRRPPSTTGRGSLANEEAVPMQGFENDDERASGPVQPPGGAELLVSATEIVGELAKAGFSTGERLFRDVLSRLPIS